MSWSVLVFPVPVAPATRPWRFIADSGMRTMASGWAVPSSTAAPNSREGPVKAYPVRISSTRGEDAGLPVSVTSANLASRRASLPSSTDPRHTVTP